MKPWSVIALLIALLWGVGLSTRSLTRPDEGRYGEIGREMAVGGDWVTPHLNGLPYFEKPPLQDWATALSIELLGPTPLAARLWTALTGLLGIALVGWFGNRLFGPGVGLRAALVLAGSVYYAALGHINTLDMGVGVFMTLAVGAFLVAQSTPEGGGSRPWMGLAWAAAAAGFLSKGLIALALPGGALILYSLLNRDFSPWRRLDLVPGLILFLALAAPWVILANRAYPPFLHFFFIHEHFERYTTTVHQRYEPLWYFLPILVGGFWPWVSLLRGALWAPLVRGHGRGFSPARFLATYATFIVLFFSFSDSKLADYLVPAFPPLALLVGRHLNQRPGPLPRRLPLLTLGGAVLLGSLALLVMKPAWAAALGVHFDLDPDMVEGYRHFGPWVLSAAGVTAGAALMAWRSRRTALPALALLALGLLGGEQILLQGTETLAGFQSGAALAAQFKPEFAAASHLYSVDTYDQTLDYYLGRTVIPVLYQDEMAFGMGLDPGHDIQSLEVFRRVWQDDRGALALMTPAQYQHLRQAGFPMRVIFEDPRRVIVARP